MMMAAGSTFIVRAVQRLIMGHWAHDVVWDVVVAGAVAYFAVMTVFDHRTWQHADESPFIRRLRAMYTAWLVYGILCGLGFAWAYGLARGIALGLLVWALILASGAAIVAAAWLLVRAASRLRHP
jgi:hypothetical protein